MKILICALILTIAVFGADSPNAQVLGPPHLPQLTVGMTLGQIVRLWGDTLYGYNCLEIIDEGNYLGQTYRATYVFDGYGAYELTIQGSPLCCEPYRLIMTRSVFDCANGLCGGR